MNQTTSLDLHRPLPFIMGVVAEGPKDSDYALARAAASGAIAAIGDLYNRYSRRVYSLCLRMTCNTADAEDLTQEVFIQLIRKIGSFRGESQFTTWLYRLTVNHVLMYFRHLRVLKEEVTEDVEAEVLTSPQSKHSVFPQVLDKIALDAALAQLPPGCRLMFVLHDMEGYSHEEIATLLGCSAGNSKSQLHKARVKLRRLLNSKKPKQR
jgi:RNA polymerase sigma-70 factor (ECF subfamily)